MNPLGFDARQMYHFIAVRFHQTSHKVKEQALRWLQVKFLKLFYQLRSFKNKKVYFRFCRNWKSLYLSTLYFPYFAKGFDQKLKRFLNEAVSAHNHSQITTRPKMLLVCTDLLYALISHCRLNLNNENLKFQLQFVKTNLQMHRHSLTRKTILHCTPKSKQKAS